MNQTQLKYARARAERIFRDRTAAIEAKHTTPAVTLTNTEKWDALLAGRFTIDRTKDRYHWEDNVIFTEARERFVDRDAIDSEQAVLNAAYRKLEDELVLGDNEQALALLKAFEAADAPQ